MPIQVNNDGVLIEAKAELINLRSEEMQEVISKRPGFWTRWSLFFNIIIVSFVLILASFIEFPDTIQATGVINGDNVPREIVSPDEKKVVKIFKTNGDYVKENEIIALLQGDGDYYEVLDLYHNIDSALHLMDISQTEKVVGLFDRSYLNIGTLQPDYQTFIFKFQDFTDYLVNGYFIKRKQILASDLEGLDSSIASLLTEKDLLGKDLSLKIEDKVAFDTLLKAKIISSKEYREEESRIISKKLILNQNESRFLNLTSLRRDKLKEISELEFSIAKSKMLFMQSLLSLKSGVEKWLKGITIISPMEGNLVLQTVFQENAYVKKSDKVGFVEPSTTVYFVDLFFPQENFGRVKIGQKAIVRIDAYPHFEFGELDGEVNFISNIASDSGFTARVKLKHQLVTKKNLPLTYRAGLKCKAEVIADNKTWFDKIYASAFGDLRR